MLLVFFFSLNAAFIRGALRQVIHVTQVVQIYHHQIKSKI